MSEYSRFLAWSARCHDRPGYGMTPGDTAYLGLRDYVEPYPCPNGLPIDTREPGECESWRRRIEKAKRSIENWNRDIQIQLVAESITDEQVDIYVRAMQACLV
jgi:hypothetical protein